MARTYICVFVLVHAMEVEGPAVDEELRAGGVHGADANRERVHVLQHRPIHLRLHFHLEFQGEDTSDVMSPARMPCPPSPSLSGLPRPPLLSPACSSLLVQPPLAVLRDGARFD